LCYDDHHHYAPVELRRLVKHANAVRAGALLTTEKDIVNLPEDSANIFGDMPVFWLRVEVEIEDEAELLRLLNPDDIRARQASDRRLAPAHP
jgi:tetraacyldisaccharide-1-P 4'-kinase